MSESSNTRNFEYDNVRLPDHPSGYIRLLHLYPPDSTASGPSFSAPLRCFISVCSIDQPTPYHAISYAWGDPHGEPAYLEVFCSDVSDALGQLPITSSLDCALRHFRELSAGSVRTLWIDQICINQADNEEKSQQVRIMGRIYSSAEQVHVWLGPAADKSDDVMEMWEEVGKKCEEEVDLASYFTSREAIRSLMAYVHNETPNDATTQRIQQFLAWAAPRIKPHLKALTIMFGRPWFRRVWVIQEFARARNTVLTCGLKATAAQYPQWVLHTYSYCKQRIWPGDSITDQDLEIANALWNPPFDTLFTIRKRRQDHNDKVQRGLLRTDRDESPPPGPGAGDYLLDLLEKAFTEQVTEATDPRDRVYALLGIAVDRKKLERLGLKPDYQNCDFERVLLLTARAIMLRGDVQMLSFSQFPKHHIVPSWVPEWRPGMATPFFHYSKRQLARLPPMFTASGTSTPAIVETNDMAVIGLHGCRIDIVEDTADPWEHTEWDPSNNSDYLTFLKQVQLLCNRSAAKEHDIYASETRRAEAVWRVPVADCEFSPNGTSRATIETSGRMYLYCLESCELFEPETFESHPDAAARLQELRQGSVYRTYLGRTGHRRPYITDRGYVGMGPTSTRAGDVVVAFAGAPITYIIRPTARDGHFEFLGDAYCDGVMDGEAWDETKVETFFLV
ncbi:heterokaryon incompatibility protein-domain-containing protein [Triangularia verruculosa]|uniref:Heterokaryon incompatibility protein-domain-containing protein n=1 Tax=Triangularia verruculosa TaxID=2587418 RepID=A0AAN6X532_9PEZI|nr:heterokaryon incompatibility protein-domain-containing protein [Triangularia verruculosa]